MRDSWWVHHATPSPTLQETILLQVQQPSRGAHSARAAELKPCSKRAGGTHSLTRVRRRPHWPAARPRAASRHGVHLQLTRGIHLQRSQVRRPHRVKQLSRADSCSALRCPQDANPTIPPAEANAGSEVLTYG